VPHAEREEYVLLDALRRKLPCVGDEPMTHDASPRPADTIWTIGHSNHPLEAFLDLLAQQRMDMLIDVRSSPYSRYASQFNRETR
jgi:hypothetical protein